MLYAQSHIVRKVTRRKLLHVLDLLRMSMSRATPNPECMMLFAPPLLRPQARGHSSAVGVRAGMRMYVVRHQKRAPNNPAFLSPLTEEGMKGAKTETLGLLRDLGVTQVYSSPFIRVLQTIQPFIDLHNKQAAASAMDTLSIKVDYSLYEHPNPDNGETKEMLPAWYQEFSVDTSYSSYLSPCDLPESNINMESVHRRTAAFVKHLMKKHGFSSSSEESDKDEVVLLASHQTVVHSLIHQCNKIRMEDLDFQQGDVAKLDLKTFNDIHIVNISASS